MSDQSATTHQQYQGFPNLDSPLMDPESGGPSIPWYQFFIALWSRVGAKIQSAPESAVITNNANNITIVSTFTGEVIGTIPILTGGPDIAVPIVGNPPFEWPAPAIGKLVVAGAQVSIKRSGVCYIASPTGGAIPLVKGDIVSLMWFTQDLPTIRWFPD